MVFVKKLLSEMRMEQHTAYRANQE